MYQVSDEATSTISTPFAYLFLGFDTAIENYGTDVPRLSGDHKKYLYGPGTILVAHGEREHVTVGDLEESVEGYQNLILHALSQ